MEVQSDNGMGVQSDLGVGVQSDLSVQGSNLTLLCRNSIMTQVWAFNPTVVCGLQYYPGVTWLSSTRLVWELYISLQLPIV